MKKREKIHDLRKTLKPFENKWVALTPDNKRVVSSGKNLIEVAKKTYEEDVVYMKVLPSGVSYAPTSL